MKTLYIDCGMGAAGDMLAAALSELLPDKEDFLRTMNSLGLPGVAVSLEKAEKCGITGTHFRVTVGGEEEGQHHHHHSHSGLRDIENIVASMPIPTMVKLDVLAVYQLIAQAESHVHGVPMQNIHFHEVGTLDALADITAVCLLMYQLKPDQVIVSPVHVGSGSVRCAHGVLPVPAPATAELLRDIPIYGGEIAGELCTPTGAALLKHFVTKFSDMPPIRVQAMGYGMGKKDFERANCVRILLGETEEKPERILSLQCNVDDMTGEAVGFALEKLLELGALDAFTVPIGMKKSRPGILLSVLCRESDRDKMVAALFRHTTTLGIRETVCDRHTLHREIQTLDTPFGKVHKKVSSGYGVHREKYEYEDLAAIARQRQMSLEEILANL
ncbi:MAG TPA: nickel pincer cofactor biosynthesis protein LarC [Candidatus Faecousia faecavium]|nr:nickel pincer cofactor biosynthesis protein LarC [Candidatus Faecousia faecavium]